MKITKRQLKRIIREACGDITPPDSEQLSLEKEPEIQMFQTQESGPCPFSTAEKLKASGMSDSEVLEWVNTMLSSFLSAGDFSLSGATDEIDAGAGFDLGYEVDPIGI